VGGDRSIMQGNLLHEDHDTMYLTPGLKLKLLPSSFISPYLAGGLGWGGFSLDQYERRVKPIRGRHRRRSRLHHSADPQSAG
jgi:hypothetical protein